MGVLYRFNPGSNPCNICTSMQGTHPTPPQVPVHPNCDCTVDRIDEDSGCAHEIRNVRTQRSSASETMELADGDFTVPLAEDLELSVVIGLGETNASWDDELLRQASNWSPPSGTLSAILTIPAGTVGRYTVKAEIKTEEIIALGDLWEACRRAPSAGDGSGLGHTISERMIGAVGGGALAIVEVTDFLLEAPGNVGGYHDDDDEVPA